MNDRSLFIEHDDACGWRFEMRDADSQPILMSTKYYPNFWEMFEDLRMFERLFHTF